MLLNTSLEWSDSPLYQFHLVHVGNDYAIRSVDGMVGAGFDQSGIPLLGFSVLYADNGLFILNKIQ